MERRLVDEETEQLALFEVRTFLGRTVLICEGIVYPQHQLPNSDDTIY